MTVMMIVASTTIENTQEKVTYFNELEATSQARLAAESAAELAIKAIREELPGFDPEDQGGIFCIEDGNYHEGPNYNCLSSGNYTVHPVAEMNNENGQGFYVPVPGTGSAGLSDDCSILDDDLPVGNVCNWNKMLYGDSVTIPLYAISEIGAFINPAIAGVNDWVLKVRTPCAEGEGDNCVRYEFEAGNDVETDPSILFWQVNGVDDGAAVSIIPNDETTYQDLLQVRAGWANTEIPASTINNAQDYEVFTMFDGDGEELQNLMESQDVTDLNLQLNIIHPLISNNGDPIPYLEWQVVMNATTPLISTKSTVVGEGYYEGANGTYYFPYVITRSSTGENTSIYTLSN